jgi:hypothetical protein
MADAAVLPPGPVVAPSDQAIIDAWLKEFYVQYAYHEANVVISVKGFFDITTTASTDTKEQTSWLSDDQIAVPIVLLLEQLQEKRNDILIIPLAAGTYLASIGLGGLDRDEFLDQAPGLYEAMKQENIRWIIIPCNDGMTARLLQERNWKLEKDLAKKQAEQEEANARSQKTKKSAAKSGQKEKKSTPTTGEKAAKKNEDTQGDNTSTVEHVPFEKAGMHWGFIVIDKKREDARWFDSHLTLDTKTNGKPRISHMFKTGWVAGKVLCGYDTVMERERGKFIARTLKHVPNDTTHNWYTGDKGAACGPWVFAMLRYILEHPTYLTNEKGLRGTFTSKRLLRHALRMAFDSRKTRADMQNIIRQEADKSLSDMELPINMSTRILKILHRPSTADIRRGIKNFGRSGRNHGGDDDDEDDDSHDHEVPVVSESNEVPDEQLDRIIEGSEKGRWSLEKWPSHIQRQVKARQAPHSKKTQDPRPAVKSAASSKKTQGPQHATESAASSKKQADSNREGWPDGVTELPNFARADDEDIKPWVAKNPHLFKNKKAGHNATSDRAVLHIRFKKTFLKDTTDEDLGVVWQYDGAVFDDIEQGTVEDPGTILQRMREHYEPNQDNERKRSPPGSGDDGPPAKRNKRNEKDPGSDSNDEDDDDNTPKKPSKAIKRSSKKAEGPKKAPAKKPTKKTTKKAAKPENPKSATKWSTAHTKERVVDAEFEKRGFANHPSIDSDKEATSRTSRVHL